MCRSVENKRESELDSWLSVSSRVLYSVLSCLLMARLVSATKVLAFRCLSPSLAALPPLRISLNMNLEGSVLRSVTPKWSFTVTKNKSQILLSIFHYYSFNSVVVRF